MPKVSQAHLDARRQQIVDAARARFASHGFARTSMADIVSRVRDCRTARSTGTSPARTTSSLRFASKGAKPCRRRSPPKPSVTSSPMCAHRARDTDHARLVAQIYAEAAVSPNLAVVVQRQLSALRAAIADLVPTRRREHAEQIAEAFVALSSSYSQQLAIRGDLDPAPFTKALVAIVKASRQGPSASPKPSRAEFVNACLGQSSEPLIPPFRTIPLAVIHEFSSEARNSTAPATSSGVPHRPCFCAMTSSQPPAGRPSACSNAGRAVATQFGVDETG